MPSVSCKESAWQPQGFLDTHDADEGYDEMAAAAAVTEPLDSAGSHQVEQDDPTVTRLLDPSTSELQGTQVTGMFRVQTSYCQWVYKHQC